MLNKIVKRWGVIGFLFTAVTTNAQYGTMPPYTLEMDAVPATAVPGVHSFAFAQQGDKWLIAGGRTNGLHGLNSSDGFNPEYKNDNIYVIDTSTWTSYSADLNQLPWNIADPIRSNNMEYVQDGNYLYMLGGYGFDSIVGVFVTFPTLTAIRIDGMISAIINNQPIAPYIRQVTDTNFTVCGGELAKLYNHYYLCFGHNFHGRYSDPPTPLFTQVYSEKIKRFDLSDDGSTVAVSNFNYQVDTNNFHRRDLTLGPIIKPGGEMALEAYGGVFQKNANLPFRNPITIDSTATLVNTSYQQVMSQYTCANFPVYDSLTQTMYANFLGGISLYDFNPGTGLVSLDTLVPFVSDVTTMTTHLDGSVEETVLPLQLPGLLGSNAKFVSLNNVASYTNEVIKFRELPNTKTLIGYMYGGIKAQTNNFGISSANDVVYRIYLTPNFSTGIDAKDSEQIQASLYPNPGSDQTNLFFPAKESGTMSIVLRDIQGKAVLLFPDETYRAGNNQFTINTSALPSGMYFLSLLTEQGSQQLKLILSK